MKRILHISSLFCLLLVGNSLLAQVDVIMSDGSYESCGGLFIDSGGQGGPGYSNGEYFVCTICPEIAGDVVSVDFVTFDLDESGNQNSWDSMAIYDGDNVSAGTLGSYSGTGLQGLFVTATPLNTSGCLTFVFQSNGTGTGNFGGSITCETPCDRPVAEAIYDAPANKRICVGDVINFDGSASYAGAGFQIETWLWDFADGMTDTSGPIVSHSWDEPGEYIVELFLIDDNGCASTNRISLQLLVSTYPSWDPFPGDTTLCLGEQLCLEAFPDDYEVTWAGPEVSYENPENTDLLDNVGECFLSEIDVVGFGPGQQLENINDLISVDISIEHSFLFDLVVTITCPSGESVVLHQQMAAPDGPNVGANGTDLGIADTEYWDYSWAANATLGTWSEEATGGANPQLPEGIYSALQPMEQLVGCDLNGAWTFEVCDLWGGDNGELNSWGLNFNPAIVPDVTEFTPDIGANADSSFWSFPTNGLDILSEPEDGNSVCFAPIEEGDYEFTYSVTNNHGCTTDSLVTISANLAAQADAGPDITFCGDATALQGGLDGFPTPTCSADAGNYTYCYDNSTTVTFTYCPDNPGDGITFMDVSFNAGSVENFFDEFWVYDGDSDAAPLLAGPIYGDLSGMSWVATNPTGCITIQLTPDGSVNCSGGNQTEWDYDVGCTEGGPQYEYLWTPADGLSDPTSPTPDVLSINGETTYELAAWPLGHPDCISYDEVSIFPAFIFEVNSNDPSCFGNDGVISMDIDAGTGTPPWTIEFFEEGVLTDTQQSNGGLTSYAGLFPGNYAISVGDQGGCVYVNDIVINSPPILVFNLSPDTLICVDGTALLETSSDMDDDSSWVYTWDGGLGAGSSVFASPDVTTTYSVFATDDAGCDSDPLTVEVALRDSLFVAITGPALICGGADAFLEVTDTQGGLVDTYEYSWTFNGGTVGEGEDLTYVQFQTGTFCGVVTDGCESPAVQACFEVVIETPLNVAFEADTTQGCFPAGFYFTNLLDPADYTASVWDFGDGAFSSLQDPPHVFDNPGFYDVSLSLTTAPGCVYSINYPNYITVFNNPTAGYTATPQPTTMPDTEISFFDYSIGDIVEYSWVFDTLNYQGTSTDKDPVFEFPMSQGGYYPVTLSIIDSNGCKDQLTRYIQVNDLLNIFVPNSFTPNNDGVNDVFFVSGTDIDPDRFELMVFSRWGDKVFETTDINQVWDGDVHTGEYYTQNDIYTWKVIVYSLTTAERLELSGSIMIMR